MEASLVQVNVGLYLNWLLYEMETYLKSLNLTTFMIPSQSKHVWGFHSIWLISRGSKRNLFSIPAFATSETYTFMEDDFSRKGLDKVTYSLYPILNVQGSCMQLLLLYCLRKTPRVFFRFLIIRLSKEAFYGKKWLLMLSSIS